LATSFASAAQQLALSIGVGTGALLLHVAAAMRGGTSVVAGDFAFAFLGVAVISALSTITFLGLSGDAGAEVSGRPARRHEAPLTAGGGA
jgi:hypothetical protein